MTDEQENISNTKPTPAVARSRFSRKRTVAGITVILLAVAGAGIYLTTGFFAGPLGDSNPSNENSKNSSRPERCQSSPEKTGISNPEDSPEKGGVEVVEDGVNLATANTITDVTAGVLLKNSSDLVARNVKISMTVQRQDGTGLRDTDGELVVRETFVPHILPGETFGTGGDARVPSKKFDNALQIETKIAVSEWWQLENDVHHFASITADVKKEQDDPEDHLNVTVKSLYCKEVGLAKASVIFRDSEGKIIYGVSGFKASKDTTDLAAGYAPLGAYQPGAKTLAMPNYWTISTQGAPGAGFESQPEWSKTEVFPYADPTEND